MGVPQGVRWVIEGMYNLNGAYSPATGAFLFWYLSGILQGDPLSGSLFAIRMDPSIHFIDVRLRRQALGYMCVCVCVCADDVRSCGR